jgi:alkanesulfonate monooxygenase SsuD/methylene tetrahydromethanopterin reductase-like flavin-dependent oxidoreductase (luciferase family)
MQKWSHAASYGGYGAVMGSKKLKAIAAKGTGPLPDVARPEDIPALLNKMYEACFTAPSFWGIGAGDRERVRQLFSWYDEGVKESGRKPEDMPRMVEMKISYDEDYDKALKSISMWLPVKGALDIPDPRELDRLREGGDLKVLANSVYTNMDQLIGAIEDLIDMGFTEIQVGSNSPDEERFIREFGKKALPYLQNKYSK